MEINNTIEITREEEIFLLKGAKLWCEIFDPLGLDFTDRGELLDSFSMEKYLDGQELLGHILFYMTCFLFCEMVLAARFQGSEPYF